MGLPCAKSHKQSMCVCHRLRQRGGGVLAEKVPRVRDMARLSMVRAVEMAKAGAIQQEIQASIARSKAIIEEAAEMLKQSMR